MLKIDNVWHQAVSVKNEQSGLYDQHVKINERVMRVERNTYPYKLHAVSNSSENTTK